MIISHQHRYIFLKTRKVGGSSVEMHLRQHCGPDDIVTPLLEEEELQARAIGARAASAILQRPRFPWEMHPKALEQLRRKRRWPVVHEWWEHESASSVRRKVGTRIWGEYFRFSIVRNPWDCTISRYFWIKSRRHPTITLDAAIDHAGSDNWRILSIRNQVAVHAVARFEHLLSDVADICARIGLPRPVTLPRLKTGIRPPRVDYREFLTRAQADRIARLCKKEIDTFGYEFDSPP